MIPKNNVDQTDKDAIAFLGKLLVWLNLSGWSCMILGWAIVLGLDHSYALYSAIFFIPGMYLFWKATKIGRLYRTVKAVAGV